MHGSRLCPHSYQLRILTHLSLPDSLLAKKGTAWTWAAQRADRTESRQHLLAVLASPSGGSGIQTSEEVRVRDGAAQRELNSTPQGGPRSPRQRLKHRERSTARSAAAPRPVQTSRTSPGPVVAEARVGQSRRPLFRGHPERRAMAVGRSRQGNRKRQLRLSTVWCRRQLFAN